MQTPRALSWDTGTVTWKYCAVNIKGGLLLVRGGGDGHWWWWWYSWWSCVILMVSVVTVPDLCCWWRYWGTNCLRWRDLNNKQINVLHEPSVWPSSRQKCPVAKPRSVWDTWCGQGPDFGDLGEESERSRQETERERGQTIGGQNLVRIADLGYFWLIRARICDSCISKIQS